MFNVDPSELMLLAIVALVVIGPKDLPRAMRFVGQWVGRARGVARHFRSGFDEMIRQAEMEEMEKKWAAENARIMAEHPPTPPAEEADDAHYAMMPLPPLPDHSDQAEPASPESGAQQEPPARS
jgi:sec-independent protein translocase protein TatB